MNDYDCYWNIESYSSDPSDMVSLPDDDTLFPFFADDSNQFYPFSFCQEDECLPPLFLPSRLDDSSTCENESMSSLPNDISTSCSNSPSTITLETLVPSDMDAVSYPDSCIPSQQGKLRAQSDSSVRRLMQPKKSILPSEKKKTRKPNVPRHIRDHIGYLAMELRSQNLGLSMKSIAKKVDRRLKVDFP